MKTENTDTDPQTQPSLEFWFEFGSTYSYLASSRIEAACEAAGVYIHWRPFLLGPLFKAQQGLSDSPFNVFPEKGRYMWRDMERRSESYGLPFARPSVFPRNGLLAARIACANQTASWQPAFSRAVFAANFSQDRAIEDPEVISGILDAVGEDGAARVVEAAESGVKAKLREQTERAASLGIFGAPSFVVGDELFWGHDRMGDAIAHARLANL